MMVSAEDRARREEIVSEHIAAENRRDVEATVQTFARPFYDVVPAGNVADGAEAVREMLQGLFTGFPDFSVETRKLHHADDAVIVEAEIRGTHEGPWAGLEPTGKRMSVRLACVFDFEGTDLVGETLYFDIGTVMHQLGAA